MKKNAILIIYLLKIVKKPFCEQKNRAKTTRVFCWPNLWMHQNLPACRQARTWSRRGILRLTGSLIKNENKFSFFPRCRL